MDNKNVFTFMSTYHLIINADEVVMYSFQAGWFFQDTEQVVHEY